MSEVAQPNHKKPEPPKSGARPESISVRRIVFVAAFDIPGKDAAGGLEVGPESRWTMTYHPWMRHIQIDHRDQRGAIRTSYVHESQCRIWEPV